MSSMKKQNNSTEQTPQAKQKLPVAGVVLAGLLVVSFVALAVVLGGSKLLPGGLLTAILAVAAVLAVLLSAVMLRAKNRPLFVGSAVCAAVMAVLMFGGSYYVNQAVATLNKVTSVPVPEVEVQPQTEAPTEATVPPTEAPADELAPFTLYFSGVRYSNDVMGNVISDVNILAAINPRTRQVAIAALPHNTYVPMEGYGSDRIRNAGLYGLKVSMDAMEAIFNTKIDYYFRVNFDGFVDVVDALGGVTVYSDEDFSSTLDGNWYHYSKGENNLNGKQALSFVRERNFPGNYETYRAAHQTEVIKAVMKKMVSAEFLKNFETLMDAVGNSFATNGTYDMIAALVRSQIADNTAWNYAAYTVDGVHEMRDLYTDNKNAKVMLPEETSLEDAANMLAQVLAGQTAAKPAGAK